MKLITRILSQPYLYIVIVLIGVSLKFYKLEQQFFWDDEICTVLHASGTPMADYEKAIPVNEVISKKYFDDLLKLNSRDLSIPDQVLGLSKMPQLTPGHYYYFIFMDRIFGDGYKTYRYFSVIVFLLSVLFLFLLTQKLFNSNLTAWIVISLYVLSPAFQVYAQEARYYSLWMLAITAMHYLFIVVAEKESLKWWLLYIVVGFLAVHTTILFYISLTVQFIYAFLYYPKIRKALVVSQLLIFLSSVPWLIYIFINREDISSNLAWHSIGDWASLNVFDLLNIHLNNFMFTFFNPVFTDGHHLLVIVGMWIFRLLILSGIVFFFIKATSKQRWFIGLMAFAGVIALIGLDLIRSSGASNMERYTLMNSLGLLVIIGFAFRKALKSVPLITGIVLLFVFSVEFMHSFKAANDISFGKRNDAYYHVEDAEEKFSGDENILIISDFELIFPKWYTMFMSLMLRSNNENIDVIYAKPEYPNFKTDYALDNYDIVYGMYLSDSLKHHLQQDFLPEQFVLSEKRILYDYLDISVYQINK
ncbi:MAG TPA: glycosyltransferase family 39 protein [Draconibacterium sp.]|nr:glycosyltransferase family 39 protein [Draconibacterium sp.]